MREAKNEEEKEINVLSDKKKTTSHDVGIKKQCNQVPKCLNSAEELGSVKSGGGGGGPLPDVAAAIIANWKSRSRACCSSRKR